MTHHHTQDHLISLLDHSSNPILCLGELWAGIPSKHCDLVAPGLLAGIVQDSFSGE